MVLGLTDVAAGVIKTSVLISTYCSFYKLIHILNSNTHKYPQTQRHTDKKTQRLTQTDTNKDTNTDTYTHTLTDRHTHKHTHTKRQRQ